MSDSTDIANLRERLRAVRENLRDRLRELELDAVLVRGKTDEVREAIAALDDLIEDAPRRKHRKITVINLPQRTEQETVA
jgi:hypothetical protein